MKPIIEVTHMVFDKSNLLGKAVHISGMDNEGCPLDFNGIVNGVSYSEIEILIRGGSIRRYHIEEILSGEIEMSVLEKGDADESHT